uniref:Uncharacterized protein n=1 Tax=Acrobeloides nanus TaxID=290746 RepID=A0A914CEY7_9BILA
MKSAIEDNITDGVGLGRPIAAEPDLPKKILQKNVQSALASPFDGDFIIGTSAANSQMWQAGETYIEEKHENPSYGIMDLSNPKVSNKYLSEVQYFLPDMLESMAMGTANTVLKYKVEEKNEIVYNK